MTAIGIISADRYYHLLATVLSLKNANIKDRMWIIVDDASSAKTKEVYKMLDKVGEKVVLIDRTIKRGLPGLADAFNDIMVNAKRNECEHVFLCPDDIVVNRYLGECIEKAKAMLTGGVEAIQFFKDSRGSVFLKSKVSDFSDNFIVIGGVDGFAVLMRTEYACSLSWKVDQKQADETGRSLIWRGIALQMQDKKILEVNESLVEHTGNDFNATLRRKKGEGKEIYGVNLNLFRRPAWL